MAESGNGSLFALIRILLEQFIMLFLACFFLLFLGVLDIWIDVIYINKAASLIIYRLRIAHKSRFLPDMLLLKASIF